MKKSLLITSLLIPYIPMQAMASSTKPTVAELLKQAGRGAETSTIEKKKSEIPMGGNSAPAPKRSVPVVDLSKVKPLQSRSFLQDDQSDQAQLEKILDQQIDEMFKLTQKFKTSARRGELWLRLAELYVEKAGFIEYRRQTDYDSKLRQFQSGELKEKPKLDLHEAKDFNQKAIQLYEWFIRDFPKDERLDQALFFLGYNYFEMGQVKQGAKFYSQLTKNFPRSSYVIESHFALGEYEFENGEWSKAYKDYEMVFRNKKHRLAGFSMYKSAWCKYRMGQSGQALKILENLILENREEMKQAEGGRKKVNRGRLETEALRDLVVIYADIGSPKDAVEYFQKMAGSQADNYVEKLAYFYADKGQREGARIIFNYLIGKNPISPKAFEYKYQIVQGWMNANRTKEFKEELYSWIKDFGRTSAWAKANVGNTELVENAQRQREATLKVWVLNQHQTAQNSRAAFSQKLADEGYQLFFSEFPDSPQTGDMHFYRAELLYDMNRFDDAAAEYEWVVLHAPNSKFAGRAAENIIIALEKGLPKDAEIAARVGNSVDPVPLTEQMEKFVKASNDYMTQSSKSDKLVEIKFRVGRLYYQHNQFDQSTPRFKDIIKKWPKSKFAEYSANLLLDTYNLRKDYSGLESIAQELMSNPNLAQTAAGKDIRNILERSKFKKAQDMEANKDFSKSAAEYENFAKANPQSPLVPSAQFNSAINYEKSGDSAKSMKLHMLVLSSKEKEADKLKPLSRRILAKLYQDSGQLESAAHEFKKAAEETNDKALQQNMLFNSAILYEALGKNNEAILAYESYNKLASKKDRMESNWSLAQLYRRAGQKQKMVTAFADFANEYGMSDERGLEAAYVVYSAAMDANRKKEALAWRSKLIAQQSKLSPNKKGMGAAWVSKIKLSDAQLKFHELQLITLPKNPKKQQAAAKAKIAMLMELNQMLAEVIKYDSAETVVSALTLLGQANLHMADSLVKAPIPAGFNKEETEQYKQGIAKLSEPFSVKGKESIKAAVDRSYELEYYGASAQQAKDLMKKINPDSMHDLGEHAFDLRQGEWLGL